MPAAKPQKPASVPDPYEIQEIAEQLRRRQGQRRDPHGNGRPRHPHAEGGSLYSLTLALATLDLDEATGEER